MWFVFILGYIQVGSISPLCKWKEKKYHQSFFFHFENIRNDVAWLGEPKLESHKASSFASSNPNGCSANITPSRGMANYQNGGWNLDWK